MGFLTPIAFLLATLLPVIIAMYLLKLRRVEQTVSSAYLWQRMVRDVEANAPWQRLRRNLLLFVQLLVVLLLMLALARPFTWAEGPSGATVVLILDPSLSMTATDVSPNRLEFAKAEINRWIDSLPANTTVTLISAGETPQVVVASTRDRRLLKSGLDGIDIRPQPSNLNAALALATAIANQNPDVTIQIFSDFAGADRTLPMPSSHLSIRSVVVGERDDNQAISAISLQIEEDGTKGFAQVTNFSDQSVVRRMVISVGSLASTEENVSPDLQLFNVIDLEIAPHSTESIVVDDLPLNSQIVHAQFAESDLLPLDDQAWAIGQNQAPTPVLLVSAGNRFLQTALALLPSAEVTVQRPEDFEASSNSSELTTQYALTIFDTYVPITATLPATNLFFIGPPSGTPFFNVAGTVEQPNLQKSTVPDPRLNNLSVSEINVLRAVWIAQPDWATTLLIDADSQAPLLFAGTVVNTESASESINIEQRIAVLAFDVRNSDLPLHVTFPLLLANLLDWLGNSNISLPSQVELGEPISFVPPPQVEAVQVFMPSGATEQLVPESGNVAFANTEQPGLYSLLWDNSSQADRAHFVVNGFSSTESDIAPRFTAIDSGITADGQVQPDAGRMGIATQQSPREWWRLVALAALLFLMAEWLIYHRGTVAKLFWRTNRSLS